MKSEARNVNTEGQRPNLDRRNRNPEPSLRKAENALQQEQVEVRIHEAPGRKTLIYLPGLHGDWTLVGAFRKALAGRLRFVELTYPRTTTWSLDEYAVGVESALASSGVDSGWLLGESFGSQVAWSLLSRSRFSVEGVILAGGFGRHPFPWGARLIECTFCRLPPWMLKQFLFGYATAARIRFRNDPDVRASIQEFAARRTRSDLGAMRHRLRLVARNDPCRIAHQSRVPFCALSGWLDPIVPWLWARSWLRKHCPELKAYKVLAADHNVLSTAPQAAADLVVRWVGSSH